MSWQATPPDRSQLLKTVGWLLAVVAAWHQAAFLMVVFILLAEVKLKFR